MILKENNTGHALIEILISTAVFAFMIAGMYSVLHAGNVSWAIQDVRVNIQDQARRTMGKLSRDLRVAQGITVDRVVESGDTTLNVSFTKNGENIDYDWTTAEGSTQNQLIRTDPSGSVVTAQNISDITVASTASDVKINLTVSLQSGLHEDASFSLVGNVARR